MSEDSTIDVTITNGSNPTVQYTGSNISMSFTDDDLLSEDAATLRVSCAVGSVEIDTLYVAQNDLDELVEKYSLTKNFEPVSYDGYKPEESISFPEFAEMLRSDFELDETMAAADNRELMEAIEEFDGDYILSEPDLDDIESFTGVVAAEYATTMNEVQDWRPVFVTNKVDQPTLVRTIGSKSDKTAVALVVPSVSYKWNNEIRWWVYESDFPNVILSFYKTVDETYTSEELLPDYKLVPLTEAGEDYVFDAAVNTFDADDADDNDLDAEIDAELAKGSPLTATADYAE